MHFSITFIKSLNMYKDLLSRIIFFFNSTSTCTWVKRSWESLVLTSSSGLFGDKRVCVKKELADSKVKQSMLFKVLRRVTHIFYNQCYCVKDVHIRSFSDPYFPAFELNTIQRDAEYLSVFASNAGKQRTRKTPNTDTFHAVCYLRSLGRIVSSH